MDGSREGEREITRSRKETFQGPATGSSAYTLHQGKDKFQNGSPNSDGQGKRKDGQYRDRVRSQRHHHQRF